MILGNLGNNRSNMTNASKWIILCQGSGLAKVLVQYESLFGLTTLKFCSTEMNFFFEKKLHLVLFMCTLAVAPRPCSSDVPFWSFIIYETLYLFFNSLVSLI